MDTPRVDIGHGMTAGLRLSEGFPDLEDGIPVGVLLAHPCSKRGGEVVEDFIPIDYPGGASFNTWQLFSRDPISMGPSVAYTCCGLHGFVTNGKWIPT
jgi:hypothetical protein